jgi:hypothetical protein
MDVGATGNLSLLIRSGTATKELCAKHWESIIQQNNKAQGKQDYDFLLKQYQAYNRLLRLYNGVKSHLIILCYSIDWESITYVRSKGYKINTQNSETYAESLAAAMNKSNNIITKLQSKKNELEKMVAEAKQAAANKPTFESLMAALSFNLTYTVPDDILLSRYNEYLKLIEKKNKAIQNGKEKQWARN